MSPFEKPETWDKFAAFHCYKYKTCTHDGEKRCGFDDRAAFLAEFEDLCVFHRVNCQKRGVFQLVETSICVNQKIFEASTVYYDKK
ncbi:uncharacterized protein LOC121735939 isoform X2 [Aricia agestis]|uniref:uncharacterized protein LOC121735939 isoform X2 n=1 Tax=Aricia agestis TaxID=91739 RepID=UPI001C2085B7|nr:uncharacterized protein LOC121735939 isoform X2 [Aricia agestis]